MGVLSTPGIQPSDFHATRPGGSPPVAVVTPVYNGEPYVAAALESVQRQSYSNLVHIVVDNCCSDGTTDTIDRIRGGRIPILSRRNPQVLPQAANWNVAFRRVPPGTKYVVLLCADDLLRSDAVATMVARAEEDDDIAYVIAGDVVGGHPMAPRPPGGKLIAPGDEVVRAFCAGAHGHIQWACFLMRWRPDLGDGCEDLFSPAAASCDVEFGLRAMRRGKVGFCLETLSWTRQHQGNVTSQSLKTHPRFRMSHWEACVAHCHSVFEEREARLWMRRAKRTLMRWQIAYLFAFRFRAFAFIAKQLSADGYRPRMLEYPLALASYLTHKLRKRAAAPADEVASISEAEFAAWPPLRLPGSVPEGRAGPGVIAGR